MSAPLLPDLNQPVPVTPEDKAAALGVQQPAPVIGVPASIAAPGLPASVPTIPPVVPPEALPAPTAEPTPQPVQPADLTLAGTTDSKRTTTSRVVDSPRDKALAAEQESILKQQEALERRKVPLEQERMAIAQRQAEEQAALAQRRSEAQQASVDASREAFEQKEAQDAADIDRMRAMRDETFWGDDTGKRIAGALAVGLGSFAATLTGGRNNALDIINQHIARWRADKEARIDQVAKAMETRDGNSARANALRMQGAELADKQHAAALERITATAAANLAKVGASAAEIQADERVLAFQKAALDARQAISEKNRTRIQEVVDANKQRVNTAIEKGGGITLNIGTQTGEGTAAVEGAESPGAIFDPLTGNKIADLGPKGGKRATEIRDSLATVTELQRQFALLHQNLEKELPKGSGTISGMLEGLWKRKKGEALEDPGLADLRAAVQSAVPTLNKLKQMGALQEFEFENLKAQLGASYVTREAAQRALVGTIKRARSSIITNLASKGIGRESAVHLVNQALPQSFIDTLEGRTRSHSAARTRQARPSKRKIGEVQRATTQRKINWLRKKIESGEVPEEKMAAAQASLLRFEAQLRGE